MPTSTTSALNSPPDEVRPGTVALVSPDGSARQVADGVAFPNGMVVTPDNSTLIVAESYGKKLTAFDIAADGSLSNRRLWADLGEGTPDGICLDADGAVWYADVPNKRCVRVREGERCSRRSTSTAAASPACSAVRIGERCSLPRMTGAVLTAWPARERASC